MKSITCRFRKDNILKWGKNGKNQAKPGAGGPAACAPPARACGTALQHSAGKEGPGGGAFCRRTKQRPERKARAAGGRPFARQPADLPAAWCAPLPPPAPHGHALCAPVLLRPACTSSPPSVLLTRRLPRVWMPSVHLCRLSCMGVPLCSPVHMRACPPAYALRPGGRAHALPRTARLAARGCFCYTEHVACARQKAGR